MKHRLFIVLVAFSAIACSCGGATQKRSNSDKKGGEITHYTFRIVAELPHSTSDYTQGFLYADGLFWEGTGGYGESQIKRYNPANGEPLKSAKLSRNYFGEGITLFGDKLYQLTWRKGKAFVYDKESFKLLREYSYEGEGWGLTTDGTNLYMSDGTDRITLRNPANFEPIGSFSVTIGGRKATNLNELEWIGGELWANVYLSDTILRIDPKTGKVVGIIDLTGLQSPNDINLYNTDVLNGIAHDPATGRIWLTGKNWNKIYQVEILPKGN